MIKLWWTDGTWNTRKYFEFLEINRLLTSYYPETLMTLSISITQKTPFPLVLFILEVLPRFKPSYDGRIHI